MGDTGWNVNAGPGTCGHPVAINKELKAALKYVECFSVMPVEMESKRERCLQIVFDKCVGVTGIRRSDLDENVIVLPFVRVPTARLVEYVARSHFKTPLIKNQRFKCLAEVC